ncbi:MAG TPA: hypothetical protein VJ739_05780 [Gemmataceae bacterium]|nr:hypothetical protein [Gemmataceae bacterium]
MAQWRADSIVDSSNLSEEPACRISWGQLYAEIDRQADVVDLWDGSSAFVMDYRVEWLVTNHIALLHLDTERLGLGDLRACFARVRGQAVILGFMLGGRLYRVRSFEELWERYLDTLQQEGEEQ